MVGAGVEVLHWRLLLVWLLSLVWLLLLLLLLLTFCETKRRYISYPINMTPPFWNQSTICLDLATVVLYISLSV